GSGTNITYRDITVHSGPGGGIYLSSQNTHHVRIDGVTVGLNPENADHIRMSTTADALNFKNTGGYIIVENCDVGYQGDDCINIHSTPGITEVVYGNEIEMIVRNGNNFYVGCEVGFKRASDFTEHEFTATVTGYEHMFSEEYGQHYRMTLDCDVPSDIEENWIIYNKSNNGEYYIIRNNFFHENRARGALLGSPNGLVENNRFYRHQLPAINISLDHGSQWIEGTGVHNLIIRNNVFEECDLIGNGSACINISAGSDFGVGGMILSDKCFGDILISGNTFINPKSEILSARSVTNLAFVNNLIKNPGEVKSISDPDKLYLNRGKINLRGYEIKDVTVIHNTWEASPYITEDIKEIDVADTVKDNELTAYGNNIVAAQ
ncbi:MAG: right-handed parallel beta-helix repeat-containing protein, partial [Clostridia bacterium]|nr:right-handed parallel beta-helix repeat-containing protein [Clostridia bacterium]